MSKVSNVVSNLWDMVNDSSVETPVKVGLAMLGIVIVGYALVNFSITSFILGGIAVLFVENFDKVKSEIEEIIK